MDILKVREFMTTLKEESDRACAVLGAAFLDLHLRDLIQLALTTDTPSAWFEGREALSAFSAKIDMSYYLGLISGEDRRDLHLIRKIRNDFAHDVDHTLSFTTPRVSNRVREMTLPKLVFEQSNLPLPAPDNARNRFQIGLGILWHVLTDVRPASVIRAVNPREYSEIVLTA
jgi:hypothetical protein